MSHADGVDDVNSFNNGYRSLWFGRYTSPDPLHLQTQLSHLGAQAYTYAANRPQVYQDPDGRNIAVLPASTMVIVTGLAVASMIAVSPPVRNAMRDAARRLCDTPPPKLPWDPIKHIKCKGHAAAREQMCLGNLGPGGRFPWVTAEEVGAWIGVPPFLNGFETNHSTSKVPRQLHCEQLGVETYERCMLSRW